ncbi:MAG: hypothetical protein EA394_10880 [Bacteroidia bacterium]|nr:MAG: hypothetical protein EA394_10880 [Bacteroidia bacterium]
MSESNTIPKTISAEYGRDYTFLRSEGLKYIEQLAHKLWTDYNVHDPGITILETLCYAITDLGYRTSYPMEDLLAEADDNTANMHRQFLSAIRALPSNPVTANDYRQLFVRIKGVRNAWIIPAEQTVVTKFRDLAQEGITESHYKQENEQVDPAKAHQYQLRGLNRILLDIDESVLLNNEEKAKPKAEREALKAGRIKEIKGQVLEVYQRYRNLCEDVEKVEKVPEQGVVICGDIEIDPYADPEEVWAKIIFDIEQYLSPSVPFYNLQEMLDAGKKTDEIFRGPVFLFDDEYPWRSGANPFEKMGFLKMEELEKSELRKEVRLSDIIRIIKKINGVRIIREIAFGLADCEEKDMGKIREAVSGDTWNLCIKTGHKPVLCRNISVLNIWKDVIPLKLNKKRAEENLDNLRYQYNEAMLEKTTEDLSMPEGRFRDPGNYQTVQNHFPEVYGIGPAGLPESASIARKAKAKQLKAYLLFFDQVLANYFAQIANVKELFSAETSVGHTYFANVVKGLKDANELFTEEQEWKDTVQELLDSRKFNNDVQRRNRFLDHLLARFAEQFNEYVFLMYRVFGDEAYEQVIEHKENFLKDYESISKERGSGFDYYNPLPAGLEELNVTGLEKRISRLLGFGHYKRKPLKNDEEGIYAVEHLLLRPDTSTPKEKHKLFLPVCIESNGQFCRPLDPYSFRITIVMPGYTTRLKDKSFRQYVERLIRMETPAHVLPRICFVDEEHLAKFEDAWYAWLSEKTGSEDPLKQTEDTTLIRLIEVMEKLFSVYEQGRLTSCEDATPEHKPLTLGRTTLGSLDSNPKPDQPE